MTATTDAPSRLERLINLVIALRETRRPLTAAEIRARVAGYDRDGAAESFRRMFERDKADLRDLGVPVETAALDRLFEDEVGYRIDPRRYDLPAFGLAPGELAALALAVAVTGLGDDAAGALRKLAVDAGEPVAMGAVPLGVALDAPNLALLLHAQVTRCVVAFTYRGAAAPVAARTVEPHALVYRAGRWYLVGHDRERDSRRVFRLDRVDGAARTVSGPGAFAAPDGEVTVDDVVPTSSPATPDTAEVLAAPDVAWLVARRARGAGRPAAGGWTAFTVAAGDQERFVGWALEFGPELVVVDPPALRDGVLAAIDRVIGR